MPGRVDPIGLFQMERHHWFPRMGDDGSVGQAVVDKFCAPAGSFNIHDYTTPMLGGAVGTVHHTIEHVLQYRAQYDAIVASTEECDCCTFLKRISGLMIYNWAMANALSKHRPPKGAMGITKIEDVVAAILICAGMGRPIPKPQMIPELLKKAG